MLVDLDYFFAQCEERRNPSIKDRPVVVCVYSGRTEDSGAVSTANYIARKYGVSSGIPIFMAKRKLKEVDAVFLPVDHTFYEEVSGNVMRIFGSYADSFEQVGIDEAYLDVTQRVKGDFRAAEELAQKMKEEAKAREGLTCSIGVGPNKLVAKIAASFQKPDGLTIVKPEDVEMFLGPLPVSRLIGVGKKTEYRMKFMRIRTIGDLARYDVQRLVEVFGRSLGSYFHNASHGMDETPVRERGEAESISRITTLKKDTRDLGVVIERADQLCEDIHAKLLQKGVSFKSVAVIAILTDMKIRSRSVTLENPTNDLQILKETVNSLIGKLLAQMELDLRRIGVKVSDFVRGQNTQRHLTDFTGYPSFGDQ